MLAHVWDFIRNLDEHAQNLVRDYGPWTYGILFAILFAETGLVITPFLPGDTLLFTAGFLASPGGPAGPQESLNIWLMLFILTAAPICGDNVNYFFGKWLGPKLFHTPKSRLFKKENLEKTHEFYEKYGPWAVILARWIPVVRTFSPFVAGMGSMPYRKFLVYSIAGAVLWVWTLVWAGYALGRNQWVHAHLEWVMLGMIALTGGPIVIEVIRKQFQAKKANKKKAEQASD